MRANPLMKPSATPSSAPASLSPSRRAWLRFKRNRQGYWSLWLFCALVLVSLCAELVSNDKPLIVRYEGQTYFPMLKDYPEKTFGGDFETPTDYLDPFIRERLAASGTWAIYTPTTARCRQHWRFRSQTRPAT